MSKKSVMYTNIGIGMGVGGFVGLIAGVEIYFAARNKAKGSEGLEALTTVIPPFIVLASILGGGVVAGLLTSCCSLISSARARSSRADVECGLLSSTKKPVSYEAVNTNVPAMG